MITATIVRTTSWTHGTASARRTRRAQIDESCEEDPERQPDRGADERSDDALLTDHPAHLPACHADGAQHPDLARALVHRQHEGVDHPEDADEHGQREHHVQERDELVEVRVLAIDPLLAGLELGVGEAGDRLLHLSPVLHARLARDVRPRPAVAGTVVQGVEQLGRDVHALDQRVERRRLEGAHDGDLRRLVGGRAEREHVADGDVVILRVVRADDRAFVVPSVASTLSSPSRQSKTYASAMVSGSMPRPPSSRRRRGPRRSGRWSRPRARGTQRVRHPQQRRTGCNRRETSRRSRPRPAPRSLRDLMPSSRSSRSR